MQREQKNCLAGDISTAVAGVIFMVDDEQNHPQEEADGAHCDVGDTQEGVLSPHPGDGAQDHSLATVKAGHRVIWLQMVKEKQLQLLEREKIMI